MNFRLSCIVCPCVALLLLANINLGRAQAPSLPQFPPGETLTYDVEWSIFTVGSVVATLVDRGHGAIPSEITTTARSQGFASLLYKLQDTFDSFFNPQTLCSTRITKKISENSRHREVDIVFNAERGIALRDERDLNSLKAPPKHVENNIPACTEDIVTAFYFLRRHALRVDQDIHMSLNDGGESHDVTIEVQARESIQTALGNRMAFRLEPKIFGTLYKKKGRLLVWLSDDDQRLPLRLKMTISVGTFTGNLRSVAALPASLPAAH
ncbi:MAG TPA: DUF3108 domain-containing protein [Terriglobia bacterium]|nr:DUF3108 domain-containing protein [Terriglobia bacterium]